MNNICGSSCNSCSCINECNGCSMCEALFCNKVCNNCNAFCNKRYNNNEYCRKCFEVMGVQEIKLKENKKLNLEEIYIPVITDKINFDFSADIAKVIGINGDRLLNAKANNINARYLSGCQEALNVEKSILTIIEFYIEDDKLEGLWNNRQWIYRQLKKINVTAVISANFSVYEDAPRLEHLFNIKRSVTMYNELIENGINAIPDVSFYDIGDLRRWCNHINESSVKVISFSFLVVNIRLKASNAWKQYLLAFRYLVQNLKQDVEIIIFGISSYRRFKEVRRAAGTRKIYNLNQSAYIQSRKGVESETNKQAMELTKDDLLIKNITYYNEVYKK